MMKRRGWIWWYGLFLGCLLLAAGAAETVRVVRSGDGGLLFWFGTLSEVGRWSSPGRSFCPDGRGEDSS